MNNSFPKTHAKPLVINLVDIIFSSIGTSLYPLPKYQLLKFSDNATTPAIIGMPNDIT